MKTAFTRTGLVRALYTSTAIVAVSLPVSAAFAQEGLEEIVVTTRKRAENLQEVPIAITAITAEAIERQGIRDVADVVKQSPSVSFDKGFSPDDNRIAIRGITANRGRPAVATLVDGIDISSEAIGVAGGSLLINPRLLDVERIEVVKGPQSALYGRSAFAGAVQYVTKSPSETWESEVSADVGSYGHLSGTASVSGPVSDKIGVRLQGLGWNENGYYRNTITGNKVGGGSGGGGALTAQFEPTDDLTFKARVDYSKDSFDQPAQAVVLNNTTLRVPAAASTCNGGFIPDAACPFLPSGVRNVAFAMEFLTGNRGIYNDAVQPVYAGAIPDASQLAVTYSPNFRASGGLPTTQDFEGSDREVLRGSLIGTWEQDYGTFSSLTAGADATVDQLIDLDKYAIAGAALGVDNSTIAQVLDTKTKTDLFSQELRFQSSFDSPVQISVGGLYWHEKASQDGRNNTIVGAGTLCVGQQGFNPAANPTPFPGNCPGFSSIPVGQFYDDVDAVRITDNITRVTNHYSAYGLVEWNITEDLNFSVEARLVNEKLRLTGPDTLPMGNPQAGGDPATVGPGQAILCGQAGTCARTPFVPYGARGFGAVGFRAVTFRRSETYTTPKATIEYKYSEDDLAYASFAQGRKPGGFSTITIGSFGVDANHDGSPSEISFDPEKVYVYEAGLKTLSYNNRLQFNIAGFYQDYADKQVSTQAVIGGQLGNVITNASSAEIYGAEIDAVAKSSDHVTLAASYTYLHGRYKDFVVSSTGANEIARVGNCTRVTTGTSVACQIDRKGNTIENTPTHSFAASINYTNQFMDTDYEWFAEANGRYRSKRWLDQDNVAFVEDHFIADVRVGLTGDVWEIVAYSDNVLRSRTVQSAATGPGIAYGGQFRTGILLSGSFQALGTIAAPNLSSFTYANLPDPRTFGVRAKYKF
jgi:outer membrane receptor protein involved in Fe transport